MFMATKALIVPPTVNGSPSTTLRFRRPRSHPQVLSATRKARTVPERPRRPRQAQAFPGPQKLPNSCFWNAGPGLPG
jgi:hypothetical protein